MAGLLGSLSTDDLVKIVLVLAAIWLTIEILGWLTSALAGSLRPLVAVIVLVLALLWYFDRL